MNIDKTNSSSFIQSYQKMQVAPVAKTKPLQKEDGLEISNQAKAMFEKNANVDIERQEKIKLLKAQVQSGEYEVNSDKVAEQVYKFWFEK